MTISFPKIASDVRVPGWQAEFDSSQAVQGPQLKPYKVLVFALPRVVRAVEKLFG